MREATTEKSPVAHIACWRVLMAVKSGVWDIIGAAVAVMVAPEKNSDRVGWMNHPKLTVPSSGNGMAGRPLDFKMP
jgi:hypothetical protein